MGRTAGVGPDPNETWTVFASKSQGLTPGFQIYDEQDGRYVIKLDPVEIPEFASAAEVIATKLFYALGYNAPENYIVRVNPERFTIEPGTEIEDSFGDKMPLSDWRFRRSIRLVPLLEDKTMRVVASKYLSGIPLGPFRYYETRSDDRNDVIRHEDRRELRGLRLFAAWLNHDDTRAQNTQDAWVEENGKHYVRHYLLDYGSTFGSGSVDMQRAELGFNYSIYFKEMKRNLLGFGFRVPEYHHVKWPPYPEYQAVGRWEGELFDCEGWRNDYPNPAFMRMTARDAFWAAKIVMRFTREELEAIVETASTPIRTTRCTFARCSSSASRNAAASASTPSIRSTSFASTAMRSSSRIFRSTTASSTPTPATTSRGRATTTSATSGGR